MMIWDCVEVEIYTAGWVTLILHLYFGLKSLKNIFKHRKKPLKVINFRRLL